MGFGYHPDMINILKQLNLIILAILCLGLAACVHAPEGAYVSPEKRQHALAQLTAWQAQGSLSVVADGRREMMSFNWVEQANGLFTIRFSVLTYSAILQDYYGRLTFDKPIPGIDPSWLTYLVETQFWLRGLSSPSSMGQRKAIKHYDRYGRLIMLSQNGWLIQYQRYVTYSGYDMPTRITISGSHIQLRMVINNWIFFPKQKQAIVDPNVTLLRSL